MNYIGVDCHISSLDFAKAKQVVTDAKRSVASATDMATEQLVVATAHQIIHLNKMTERPAG